MSQRLIQLPGLWQHPEADVCSSLRPGSSPPLQTRWSTNQASAFSLTQQAEFNLFFLKFCQLLENYLCKASEVQHEQQRSEKRGLTLVKKEKKKKKQLQSKLGNWSCIVVEPTGWWSWKTCSIVGVSCGAWTIPTHRICRLNDGTNNAWKRGCCHTKTSKQSCRGREPRPLWEAVGSLLPKLRVPKHCLPFCVVVLPEGVVNTHCSYYKSCKSQ